MSEYEDEFLNGSCNSCGQRMCPMCGRCGPLAAIVIQGVPGQRFSARGLIGYCSLWCAWEQRDETADLELITSDFEPCDDRPKCPRCNTWGWVVPVDGAWRCRPCEVDFHAV